MKVKTKQKESQVSLPERLSSRGSQYAADHDLDGWLYTKIDHIYTEALARVRISTVGNQLLRVLERNILGWNKKKASISTRQFQYLTGIKWRGTVSYGLRQLEWQRIIKIRNPWKKPSSYSLQLDFTLWRHWNLKEFNAFYRTEDYRTPAQEK